MEKMSTFTREQTKSIPAHWKRPLAWAILILALAASAGVGYLAGRAEVPTPITVETVRE